MNIAFAQIVHDKRQDSGLDARARARQGLGTLPRIQYKSRAAHLPFALRHSQQLQVARQRLSIVANTSVQAPSVIRIKAAAVLLIQV